MKLVSIIYITFLLFISLTCGLDLPVSDSIPYGNVNNYDPPRANPSYCQGFDIEYPITPGLAFEIGSTQELHWAVNQSVSIVPDYIFRVRLMNSTQHAKCIINGVSSIYTQGKKGSISFPLKVEASSGIYHYRIYVDYPGQPLYCIYESVPFTLIGNPYKNQVISGDSYNYTNPGATFLVQDTHDFGMSYPLGG